MREAGAVACRVPLKFIFHLNEVFISCFICVYIIKISPFSYFSELGLNLSLGACNQGIGPGHHHISACHWVGAPNSLTDKSSFQAWWYGDNQEEMEGLMV